MDVETLGRKVNGCVVGGVAVFLIILSLAAIGVFGFDVLFGEIGAKTADIAVDYSIPAVRNVLEPGAQVLWDEGSRAVKGFLPTDAVTLGPITIDPVWKSADGVDSGNNVSDSGGSAPGSDSNSSVVTAIPCVSNTAESRAALTAWLIGDWEATVANINLTGQDDCLAKGLYSNYMSGFEIALGQLQNAQSESQIRAAAETIRRLNPAYPGSYSALRFIEANSWLMVKPLNTSQKHLLAGAMIAVNSADMSWWCAEHVALCQTEGDQFDVSIDFGNGWAATYLFSREEIEQIESALGLTKGILTTVGNSIVVPGSVVPDQIGIVPAPWPDQYAISTPEWEGSVVALCPSGTAVQAGWYRWIMVNGIPTEVGIFTDSLSHITGEQVGDGKETLCKVSDGSWAWPGNWQGWSR